MCVPPRESTTETEMHSCQCPRNVSGAISAGLGAGLSFPNKISSPAAAPSLSLRSLQGQGGELDLALNSWRSKSPPCRKRRDKSGAPSRIKMRKGWASPPAARRGGNSSYGRWRRGRAWGPFGFAQGKLFDSAETSLREVPATLKMTI